MRKAGPGRGGNIEEEHLTQFGGIKKVFPVEVFPIAAVTSCHKLSTLKPYTFVQHGNNSK